MWLSPQGYATEAVPMGLWLIRALLTLSSSHTPTPHSRPPSSPARPLQQHRLHQPGDRPGGPHTHRHLPGTCRKCPQHPSQGTPGTPATRGGHREGVGSPRRSLGPSQLLSPAFGAVRTYELLHRMAGEGLSVEYCFSRRPFPGDPHMVAIQIQISNNTDAEVKSLRVSEPKLLSGMRIQEFPEIGMARHGCDAAGGTGTGVSWWRGHGTQWQPCAFRAPGTRGHGQRADGH